MRRGVSYQGMLDGRDGPPQSVYVRLGDDAITTRRKEARREVAVSLSKPQRRWLREVSELSGAGIDEGAVVRSLVDLGMQLDVDWTALAGGKALRRAVRESVMVRRPARD